MGRSYHVQVGFWIHLWFYKTVCPKYLGSDFRWLASFCMGFFNCLYFTGENRFFIKIWLLGSLPMWQRYEMMASFSFHDHQCNRPCFLRVSRSSISGILRYFWNASEGRIYTICIRVKHWVNNWLFNVTQPISGLYFIKGILLWLILILIFLRWFHKRSYREATKTLPSLWSA